MTDFGDKLKNINKKLTSNKTKHLRVENELKVLQTLDSSLFNGQSYFNNDKAQFFLTFQPIYKIITTFSGLSGTISEWGSKGLLNEKIKSHYTVNKSRSPKLVWMNNSRIKLEFNRSCWKQDKASFTWKL